MTDYKAIKEVSLGRCGEIIEALTPLPRSVVEQRGNDLPCPLCGGESVIFADKRGDANDTGSIVCRKCTPEGATGDIIGTVAKFGRFDSQGGAAKAIADYLGLSLSEAIGMRTYVDIIGKVCEAKSMPREAFAKFGPTVANRGRNSQKVARVPVYDHRGEIHSHFDLSPTDKGLFKRGKGNAGLFLPGRLPQPSEAWYLVEGVKDASAMVGLGYNACGLPGSKMATKYAPLFKGCEVVVVPDLDTAGSQGAEVTAANLCGVAASVRIARLPGQQRTSGGDDVRDCIRQHGAEAVRQAIDTAEPWAPKDGERKKDEPPEVILTLRYSEHVDTVINHLGRLGWESPWIPPERQESRRLYQRGGLLVEVIVEAYDDVTTKCGNVSIAKGTPRIRSLPKEQLSVRITDACSLLQEIEKGETVDIKPVAPPAWLRDAIYTQGDYGAAIRRLEAIVSTPTIKADGTIVQTPGYDQSGLLYLPTAQYETVPDHPSRDDAIAAAARLLGIVTDFPFQSDADKSAWLAMVLSMIARPCIAGCVPLFAATANAPGVGKGLLLSSAWLLAYGHDASVTSFPRDDEEMRKRITSIAMEAAAAVLLDNIDRPLGGASLDAAITAERWKDRELGVSRTIDLPLRTVWVATGNNLRFAGDIARRVIPIRLHTELERPEERTEFQHPNLLSWVRENRTSLVRDALMILRAYFAAGQPEQKGGAFGSFDAWSRTVRAAIVWCDLRDPLVTRETARADDESVSILQGLVAGLLEVDEMGVGVTARQIIDAITNPDAAEKFPAMREAITEGVGRPDARRLGYLLRRYRGRIVDGRQITNQVGHGGVQRWSVTVCGGDGSGDKAPPSDHHNQDHHHSKHCDLPHENAVGGDGGDDSLPSRMESERELYTPDMSDTHDSNTGAAETSPPSQPSPPPTFAKLSSLTRSVGSEIDL